jgi:membrane protein YdbS with pleckstrin-like domain
MRKPEKKLRLLWGSIFSVILLLIGVAFLLLPSGLYQTVGSVIWPPMMVGAIAVAGILYIDRAYRAWGFEVREDHLYIQHGVFTKVKSMVPFVRIQHVDTQRNFLERIFGLSRVVVYTAGSRGSDVQVKGLVPGDASQMQEKLRDVAIESEDRDAV